LELRGKHHTSSGFDHPVICYYLSHPRAPDLERKVKKTHHFYFYFYFFAHKEATLLPGRKIQYTATNALQRGQKKGKRNKNPPFQNSPKPLK
jgi:hypothetical protein